MKILVNNEEVVSNSNLQIKEEMLSTSSTILKNCYPKTWEEDKDYVSRYYFPKDYSKCKIVNEIEHPEIPGTTTKGTNLNINYDNSLKWELNGLFGDTFQNTYTGKNLCGIPDQTITKNGVTITIKDGEITINGTASAGITQYLTPKDTTTLNGDYTLNLIYVSGSTGGQTNKNFNVRRADNNNYIFGCTYQNGNSKYTYNVSTSTQVIFGIYIISGATFSNFKFKPQLTMGTSSDYDYEPYVGGVKSPNPSYPQAIENVTGLQNINVCGKNLLNNVATTQEINDITFTRNSDGSFKVNGTASAIATLNLIDKNFILPAGQYTLTGCPTGGGTNTWRIDINNGQVVGQRDEGNGATFTLTEDLEVFNVRIRIANGVNVNNLTFKPMLEVGNQKTTYEPYIGQNYEVNLGKNLFDGNYVNAYIGGSSGYQFNYASNTRTAIVKIKPNTTYTITKFQNTGIGTRFSIYEYPTLLTSSTEMGANSRLFSNSNVSQATVTTSNTGNYLYVYVTNSIDDIPYLQIEAGSTSTEYTSYFTPIELNKIGDYQDKIYKDNGKWYIEKKIAPVNFDGSENWVKGNVNNNTVDFRINSSIGAISTGDNHILGYFNRFIGNSNGAFIDTECFWFNQNGYIRFRINDTYVPNRTVEEWKTWLSSNNISGCFVLDTPTYTEITNEELINQLEAIYYDMLNNGINNIIISSENLSMPIEIHYNFKEAWTEEELIFSGLVKNTGKISLNPRQPHYVDLQILDFKDLLSTGETLNYVISGKTITEAINQVVSSISDYGFVVGNINIVNPNELIGAYSTLNKTAYDVFQYIADITQSRWSTRVIDENTIAIDFNDPSLMEEGTPIESTQEFYENNEINDISFSYSTNDYRNKQIITSDEVYGNVLQTETKVADGYTKTFVCENKIGTITGITLNGVNATFITKSDEALGLSGDFIYQPGETTFISSNTIATGGVIVISYYPIVKGREIVINSTEISRINEQINRKGTISRYENRNDSTSSQELIKIGQSYIKYKGQAEITLKVVSTKNIWNIGQIVSYDAPLEELTTDYMVKSKTIDMYLNANKTFYTYELTSNYNYENAINYFDNQRAKNQGNIGEGETITRNIDLESTALIKFYDTSIEEVSIGTDTTLDFQLDSVII